MKTNPENLKVIRVAIVCEGDPLAHSTSFEVPADMAEIVKRLLMTRINSEIDWFQGYEREEDSVSNALELDASMIERRARMGLDN